MCCEGCGYESCRCDKPNEDGYECSRCGRVPTRKELNSGRCKGCTDQIGDTVMEKDLGKLISRLEALSRRNRARLNQRIEEEKGRAREGVHAAFLGHNDAEFEAQQEIARSWHWIWCVAVAHTCAVLEEIRTDVWDRFVQILGAAEILQDERQKAARSQHGM